MAVETRGMERKNCDSAKTLEQLVKGCRVTIAPVFCITSENVMYYKNDYNFNLHNKYVLQYRMYK